MSFNTVPVPTNHLMKTPSSLLSCVRKQKEFLTFCSPEKICSQERQAEAQRTFYLLSPEGFSWWLEALQDSWFLGCSTSHRPLDKVGMNREWPGPSLGGLLLQSVAVSVGCRKDSVFWHGCRSRKPVRQLCHISDGIKSCWTPTGTERFQLHPKHNKLEEKSGH